MRVTSASQTAEGTLYSLNNGDALLIKETVTIIGRPTKCAVYVFANGRTYSARTGRFSRSTVHPALAAVRHFNPACGY